jgi:hypothetical protein
LGGANLLCALRKAACIGDRGRLKPSALRRRRIHQHRVGTHRARVLIDDDEGIVTSRIRGGNINRP